MDNAITNQCVPMAFPLEARTVETVPVLGGQRIKAQPSAPAQPQQTGVSRRPAENRKGPSLWRAASRSREMAQVGRVAGRMAGCAVICGSNP